MKNKKPPIGIIPIFVDVLTHNIFVSYGISYKKFVELQETYIIEVPLEEKEFGDGCCLLATHKSGQELLWIWTKRKSVATLAHECIHAIFKLFDSRGIPITYENQETFAYFVRYLIQEVLDFEKENKKQRR